MTRTDAEVSDRVDGRVRERDLPRAVLVVVRDGRHGGALPRCVRRGRVWGERFIAVWRVVHEELPDPGELEDDLAREEGGDEVWVRGERVVVLRDRRGDVVVRMTHSWQGR